MKESPGASPAGELTNATLIRRLLQLTWQFKGRCIFVLLLQTIVLTLAMLILRLTGLGIDYLRHITMGAREPNWLFGWHPPPEMTPDQTILVIAVSVAVAAILRAVVRFYNDVNFNHLLQVEIVPKLRERVYDKLQRLSFRFFDSNASGTIINRVTSDVQSVRLFIDGVLLQVILLFLTLTVFLFMMLNTHVWLTIVCLLTTPLLAWLSVHFSQIMRPAYKQSRELMDKLVLNFVENMQGIATIKGFNLEDHSRRRFKAETEGVLQQQQSIFWKVSTYGPLIGFISQLNIVILLAYGGWLVAEDRISLGSLVVFAGILQQFSGQISNIATVSDHVQQCFTGARRVFEILDAPIDIQSPAHPVVLSKVRGEVAFHGVSFSFQANSAVLQDITFSVRPGEVVAVAGPTGAGKSALLSLIPRFYDPQEGAITLDGHDLRTLALEDLRRRIGIVFQENFLFSNTIASNIAFGNPAASREQIERAARLACAHEFIMEFPDGYDTILMESGQNLSGGQRQRLAIARALLLEPTILILDDPTAAIDPETEHEILEAVEKAIAGRTTFIVAHRLSTLRRADRIIVLDEGRIIQMGTHEELIQQEGLYRQAVSIQAVDPESMRLLRQGAWNRKARLGPQTLAQPKPTERNR